MASSVMVAHQNLSLGIGVQIPAGQPSLLRNGSARTKNIGSLADNRQYRGGTRGSTRRGVLDNPSLMVQRLAPRCLFFLLVGCTPSGPGSLDNYHVKDYRDYPVLFGISNTLHCMRYAKKVFACKNQSNDLACEMAEAELRFLNQERK